MVTGPPSRWCQATAPRCRATPVSPAGRAAETSPASSSGSRRRPRANQYSGEKILATAPTILGGQYFFMFNIQWKKILNTLHSFLCFICKCFLEQVLTIVWKRAGDILWNLIFSYAFNLCITRVKNDYVNSQFLRFVFLLLVFISCELVLAAPRPAAGYWLPAAVINISRHQPQPGIALKMCRMH